MTARPRWILAALAIPILAGCGGVPAGSGRVETGLDQAALLAASCSGCHAPGGSAAGIASLDGMTVEELQGRPLAYRRDADGGSAMHRMARGYTEQQIATIANYLGDR
jgi:cytochrome c553